ncbi:MAG: RNA polymerase sigma factor [Candidatus Dormibacteraceae bacterium]
MSEREAQVRDAHVALIARAKAGDPNAFDDLVRPLLGPAYRLSYSMLLDRQEAEDAVQEGCFKAWRKVSSFRYGSAFRPWFMTIVSNQCRSIRRRSWWSVLKLNETPDRPAHSEPDGVLDLQGALEKLPRSDRALLTLRYYMDLPVDEVAQILGISASATKSRMHRLLLRLRPELELSEEVR